MQWEQGLATLAKRKLKFKERTALLPQSPREVLHVYLFADFLEVLWSESYFLGEPSHQQYLCLNIISLHIYAPWEFLER